MDLCGLRRIHFLLQHYPLTIWNATYWLSGYVKLLTAAASVATAVVLPFLVPKVLMLIKSVKLSEERRAQLERTHPGFAE